MSCLLSPSEPRFSASSNHNWFVIINRDQDTGPWGHDLRGSSAHIPKKHTAMLASMLGDSRHNEQSPRLAQRMRSLRTIHSSVQISVADIFLQPHITTGSAHHIVHMQCCSAEAKPLSPISHLLLGAMRFKVSNSFREETEKDLQRRERRVCDASAQYQRQRGSDDQVGAVVG